MTPEQRAALKAKCKKPTNPERVGKHKIPGRLPHGATFYVVYDAEVEQWHGHLTVSGQEFTDKHSALFRLLPKLDRMFRDWLATQPKDG